MASFGINLAHSNDGSRGVLELSAAEAIQPTGQSSKTADVTASGPIIYFCSGSEVAEQRRWSHYVVARLTSSPCLLWLS